MQAAFSLFHQRTLPLSRRAACDVFFRSPRRLVARNFIRLAGDCGHPTVHGLWGLIDGDRSWSRRVAQLGEHWRDARGQGFKSPRERSGGTRAVDTFSPSEVVQDPLTGIFRGVYARHLSPQFNNHRRVIRRENSCASGCSPLRETQPPQTLQGRGGNQTDGNQVVSVHAPTMHEDARQCCHGSRHV